MFNGRNDKIFILRQNQIRIVNVILYKSFWRWQNPALNGFYDTGRQRIPSACWCHYFLRSKCACVNRDLSLFKKYSKTIRFSNHILGVLDKRHSVTHDMFLSAFHLELNSHFSTSSKNFTPTRLEEELGKSLSYKFNQCSLWAHGHDTSPPVGYGYISTCDE